MNIWSMMLRIVLAMVIGGIFGFDREMKHRPAGFRTFMLVAMGSAVTVILGQYLSLMLTTMWATDFNRPTDVVRLSAQVISGIGFIGTGTILVTARKQVKGLTTASGLWASACMGIAIGAGFYECVIIGFVLIILCMKLLPLIETVVLANARNMNIYVEMDSVESVSNVVNLIKAKNINLFDVEINREKAAQTSQQINALFNLRLPQKQPHTEVLAALAALDGIITIEEV